MSFYDYSKQMTNREVLILASELIEEVDHSVGCVEVVDFRVVLEDDLDHPIVPRVVVGLRRFTRPRSGRGRLRKAS